MTVTPVGDPTAYRVDAGGALAAALLARREALPAPVLEGGVVRADVVERYRRVVAALPGADRLAGAVRRCLQAEDGAGYLVLGCRELLDGCELEGALTLVTALLTLVATPLRVFDRWGLWKPLGTNLAADPMRSTGVGYNPLHIDLVNATLPPDYSVLLCVRPDPQGAGHSLVANLRQALAALPPEDVALLQAPVFTDGAFYDLTGVGEEYKPFPILDGLPAGQGFVRFTAKMLAERDPDDPYTRAARAFERELVARQHRFLLGRGDVLVVNQHLACHGREALGEGQASLAEGARRLLMQTFLREQPAAAGGAPLA